MNRASLCRAVERLSSAAGYDVVCATAQTLPSLVRQYPVALVVPPEFREKEGRNHGRVTYRLTMHLLHGAAKLSPAERATLHGRMEHDALTIFSGLSLEPFVAAVEQLSMAVAAKPMTNHGDTALTVTADVVTIF